MKTVNKNTYTFPDRKYKNRFKNYSNHRRTQYNPLLLRHQWGGIFLGNTVGNGNRMYKGNFGEKRTNRLVHHKSGGKNDKYSGRNRELRLQKCKRRDKRYLQLLQQNQNRRTRSRKYSRDTHIGNRRKLFFFSHLDTERCKHDL